jgi:uncharacterized SAM-binding protein YcdF (DUF218 family)
MQRGIATLISRLFFIIGFAVTIWFVGGFFKFSDLVINTQTPNQVQNADAIVSLTGGSRNRLTEGVKLLELNKGRKLLISGVFKKATIEEIRIVTGGSRELFACCIDLGRQAIDTIGNAEEVKQWVNENNFNSIILITDNYHMPRSLLEISNANQGLEIIPYGVKSGAYIAKRWWEDDVAIRGLFNEYLKFRTAQIRLIIKNKNLKALKW